MTFTNGRMEEFSPIMVYKEPKEQFFAGRKLQSWHAACLRHGGRLNEPTLFK